MSPYIPFSVLSALMRMGHTYQLPDVIDDAARRLEDYFTTDFNVWLQYCREEKDETFDFSEDEGADVFEAVNLARLTGKVSILPLALYKCCQQNPAAIMSGIRRGNGDVVRLCQEDVERCVRARDRLFRESCKMIDTVTGALAERAPRCVTHSACSRRMAILVEAFTAMFATLINTDALSGLEEQLGSLATMSEWTQLCDACREELVRQHVKKQRETWGSLLKILDMEHRSLTYRWSGLMIRK